MILANIVKVIFFDKKIFNIKISAVVAWMLAGYILISN